MTTPGPALTLSLLQSVDMLVTVELGRTQLQVKDLLELAAGSVVELDRPAGAPVDVLVNGTPFARGEVVVVDDEFAVRIVEVLRSDESTRTDDAIPSPRAVVDTEV